MKVDGQIEKECWLYCKVDRQIEEEWQRTIFYLQRYSCPKLYGKKLSNQTPTVNTVSNTRRTTLCWMRGMIKELPVIKLTLYLSFFFRNQPYQSKNMASTPLYLVIYSSFLGFSSHSHRKFATQGWRWTKIWQSPYSSHYPQWQTSFPCDCNDKSNKLE